MHDVSVTQQKVLERSLEGEHLNSRRNLLVREPLFPVMSFCKVSSAGKSESCM
jgi:hypothetical protein